MPNRRITKNSSAGIDKNDKPVKLLNQKLFNCPGKTYGKTKTEILKPKAINNPEKIASVRRSRSMKINATKLIRTAANNSYAKGILYKKNERISNTGPIIIYDSKWRLGCLCFTKCL